MNNSPRSRAGRRGGTLTELMVAVVILSIGVLGLFSAFRFIARSTFISRAQSLATNLGQERIESLKNLSYYSLLITTNSANIPGFSPNIPYDTGNYAPETIVIGGITFTRYTHVGMADMSGSDITNVAYTYPDTGLKKITVTIVWSEQGVLKKWSLNNLLENPSINPLDSTISGTINSSAGGPVASAVVVVEQNENWGATSAADGTFSFAVYHGTYTLRASSDGYNDGISGSVIAGKGLTANTSLTLSVVATGYVYGAVWYNPDLVISQIVSSTETEIGDGITRQDVEYVELYNPTTHQINIGATNTYPKNVALRYRGEFVARDKDDLAPGFDLVHVTTYVAAGHYYLYANATSFYIMGAQVIADAYYNSALSYPNYIVDNDAGAIQIYRQSTGEVIDTVCWNDNSGGCPAPEGTPIPDSTLGGYDGIGTPPGMQVVRVSSPGISAQYLDDYGRAYDSGSSAHDFIYDGSFTYTPRTMSSGQIFPITGKVATGTYVSASDPNSGSTVAYTAYITSGALSLPYAKFGLGGISTGTWNVAAVYGSYAAFIDTVTITQNTRTSIPNANTTPPWQGAGLFHVQLNSATVSGFVKGVVTNTSNQPIPNITIQGGGASKVTGSNGVYFMAVSSGTVTLIANPNNANASYIQDIQAVTVTEGAVTTQDFTLSLGGRITGYATTGTTPLAFQPIAVVNGIGSQVGSGVTDSAGNFTIRNISSGTYTVFPVLESGQDVSPNTLPAILTGAGSVFVGTFTVSGAFGNIAGTVSDASGLVTSGALILASTNAIASTPAAIVGSSAPAQVPIYMASSKADGTYLMPVRGGSTYNVSVYVPVISMAGTVSITTKTYSGITVSPSATTTRDVTIP